MRIISYSGVSRFVSEIRWSEQEAIDTGDGIDIAYLNYPRWDPIGGWALIRDRNDGIFQENLI